VSAVEVATAVLDRSAGLQQGTRHFSALYERNAYLVYNLSLRIACDRAVAIESARGAFLSALAAQAPEEGLVDTAVRQALAVAGDRPAAPNGAGDAEAEAMLAATARLTPPERAALALTGLTDADAAAIATTLNVSDHVAESIVERAFAALGSELGTQSGETESAYRSWLLVEPPLELWETLYPDFYRALERKLREGQDGAAVPVVTDRPSRRARRRARRAARRAAASAREATDERPRRWRRRAPFAVAILAVAAGGFLAATRTGLIPSGHESTPQPPEPPSTFGSGMSPGKLDQLRRREIAKTRDFAARKVASVREKRDAAARRKAHARAAQRKAKAALAKRRKLASRRTLRRRREDAARRQQQQQQQPQSTPKPPRRPTRGNSTTQPSGGRSSNGSNPATGTPHNADNQPCILNQEDGTYICPQ
jgi:hypothetical protein